MKLVGIEVVKYGIYIGNLQIYILFTSYISCWFLLYVKLEH